MALSFSRRNRKLENQSNKTVLACTAEEQNKE